MMDDEQLLEDIGRGARELAARDRQRFGGRLRRLSAGELSEEEEAALRAEAEGAEQARLDYEAFRPLGEDFQARMVREWQAHSADEEVSREQDTPPVPRSLFGVVPSRRSRRWAPGLALAAVLSLATVGLVFLRPGFLSPAAPAFDLPTYTHELVGQQRATRSPNAALASDLPTFAMGSSFRLILRPDLAIETAPSFAFLLAAWGDDAAVLEPWRVHRSISPDGVVEISGILGEDLDIEPGDWTFVFLQGRPGGLPEPETLADLEAESDDWEAIQVDFRVVADSTAGGPPLEVLYDGCYAAWRGPVCSPYDQLTFWVRSTPTAEIEIQVGGRPVKVVGETVDGGRRFAVPVTWQDGEVKIVASSGGREAVFSLSLVASPEPRWFNDAYGLAYTGDIASARQKLETGLAEASPELRGVILNVLAELEDNDAEKVARFEEAMPLNRQSGRLLNWIDDFGNLNRFHVQERDFAQLSRRLEALDADLPPDPPGEVRFHRDYYRGIFESGMGRYRGALAALESASRLARRLNLTRYQALAEGKMALVLHNLGRGREAVEQFDQLDASALSSCDQARLDNNQGWIRALARGALGDPLVPLGRALDRIRGKNCAGHLLLNLRLNRALALEQRGHYFEARQALVEAEDLQDSATALHALWWQDIEGRLALAEGRGADALEHYGNMEAFAEEAFDPRGQLWARGRRAVAHQSLGQAEAALKAFAEAEILLEDQSLQVPLAEGRENFVADRQAITRAYLALLLQEERHVDALEVARRSRSRILRAARRGHRLANLGAEERATWDLEISRYHLLRAKIEAETAKDRYLSGDALSKGRDLRAEQDGQARQSLDHAFRVIEPDQGRLPPLREGELILAYHPLPEGWVGFAARPGRVDAQLIDLGSDEDLSQLSLSELSRHLLEPFRRALEESGSDRLRILPYGALQEVDIHALPWAGDVLLAKRLVVYGLDLESPPTKALSAQTMPRALVIGDPRGDLPGAGREAATVEAVLRRRLPGAEVIHIEGSDATLGAFRHHLAGVDLLHFAGHSDVKGRLGWESSLLLAGDGQLTLGDILALKQAPAQVILSSCKGADVATSVASLGLAQAFLVAGSESVVAALRPVDDGDPEGLFQRLYDESWDGVTDLADRFREAQLAGRRDGDFDDWASFRILVP